MSQPSPSFHSLDALSEMIDEPVKKKPDVEKKETGFQKRERLEQETSDKISDMELDLVLLGDGIDLDEDGLLTRQSGIVKTLEGAEAASFLGVPTRKSMILQRGDYARIHRKFKPLLKEYTARGLSTSRLFWKNITVRVFKRSEIGKVTSMGAVSGVTPKRYAGTIFDGTALKIYLSEVKSSTRSQDYIVQLLSVKVTEDMESV